MSEGRPADFDPRVLRELFPTAPERVSIVLESFRTVLPDRYRAIVAAWEVGGDRLAAEAHGLKGTCLSVGALRLGLAAKDLEDAARAREPLEPARIAFEAAYRDLLAMFGGDRTDSA